MSDTLGQRKSFIFYRSFYEAIKDLPRDIQGEVYTAIMEYGLNGITTENLKPVARSIFTLIKPQLDANEAKRSNGSKGGKKATEPQANGKQTTSKPQANGKQTTSKPQANGKQTTSKPQANGKQTASKPQANEECIIDNVNVNDNNQSKIDSLKNENFPTPQTDEINFEKLISFFNQETNCVFGRVLYPISEQRKKNIRARIREHGKEAFVRMITKAVASDFLKGQNTSGFHATFDWLIKPANFDKVLSGNYDNHKTPTTNDRLHVTKPTGGYSTDF